MTYAIEVKDLNKQLGGFSLKHINLNIPTGSIVGLIGENGAGKTTLIKTILNILKKHSGEVRIMGAENTSDEYTGVKEYLGIVFDDISIHESFTASDVNKIMKYSYKYWDEAKFNNYLEKFEISSYKKIKEYSAGMKKKLPIAMALSRESKLLILDEPTSNLDPIIRDEIIDELGEFTREEDHTILISSHILSDLEKICDYIAFIHKGEIILFEEKDVLLDRYSMYKVNHSDFARIPKDSIIHSKVTNYGYELLAIRDYVPKDIVPEYTSLEDIILNYIKSKKEKA